MQAHKNNIGLLRLILAGLVVVGHSSEIIDGNRSREPLTVLFHTLSLGELAVDGFFLLSGYLIAKSMVRTGSLPAYFWHRFMRIVPAFAVAFLLCVFVIAPLVGGHPLQRLGETLKRLLTLREPPAIPGAFDTFPNSALDGSLWTIAYEFRCYVLVAVLWAAGLLNRRGVLLVVTILAVIASAVLSSMVRIKIPDAAITIVGDPGQTLRLTAIFMVGVCFYLFWQEIYPRLSGWRALGCTLIVSICLFERHVAELGLITLGAYALFWLAMKADIGPLQTINDRWDISYGVYLYGWPLTMLLVWLDPGIGLWLLAPTALMLSVLAGVASWYGIEKWAKSFVLAARASAVPLRSAP